MKLLERCIFITYERMCNNAITVLLIMQALMGAPKVPGMSENGGLPVRLHHPLIIKRRFLRPSP